MKLPLYAPGWQWMAETLLDLPRNRVLCDFLSEAMI